MSQIHTWLNESSKWKDTGPLKSFWTFGQVQTALLALLSSYVSQLYIMIANTSGDKSIRRKHFFWLTVLEVSHLQSAPLLLSLWKRSPSWQDCVVEQNLTS